MSYVLCALNLKLKKTVKHKPYETSMTPPKTDEI